MATRLSGKGVWVVTAAEASQAIPQAPLMGATHILAKVGDTYRLNDGTLSARDDPRGPIYQAFFQTVRG